MLDAKKISRNAVSAILLAYFAVAAGLAAVGLLVFDKVDPQVSSGGFFVRSEFFSLRLIWAEILVAVGFLGGLLMPFIQVWDNREHTGAGYIVISNHIMNTALISLFILLATIFIPVENYRDTFFKFHIAIQIIVAVAAVIKITVVLFSMAGHQDGIESLPDGIKKPSELVLILKVFENDGRLNSDQMKAVKKIRECIKYSIPEQGNISTLPEYRKLADDIERFAADISDGKFTDLKNQVKLMENAVTVISSKIKNS